MTQFTATFETGVNGNTIAVADAGSANAFDAVLIGTGAALVYDNAHVYGSLAAKVSTTGTVSASRTEWTTAGTLSNWYGRVYLYFTGNIDDLHIMEFFDSGGGHCAAISMAGVANTGKIELLDATQSLITGGRTTNTISLNQWIRLEYHLINNAAAGSFELKLFNSPDSTTPTETVTTTNQNTSADTLYFRHGVTLAQASVGPFWMDNIVIGATSYPGPVLPATVASDTPFPPLGRGASW